MNYWYEHGTYILANSGFKLLWLFCETVNEATVFDNLHTSG